MSFQIMVTTPLAIGKDGSDLGLRNAPSEVPGAAAATGVPFSADVLLSTKNKLRNPITPPLPARESGSVRSREIQLQHYFARPKIGFVAGSVAGPPAGEMSANR